jgi:hypothetical protein
MLGFFSAARAGLVIDRTAKVAKAVTKDKPQGNMLKLDLTLIKRRVILGALGPGGKVRTALGYCYCTLGQKRVVLTESMTRLKPDISGT